MRTRKPIKVVSATATAVTKHKSPTAFREGKIKAYLTQLGMDVREYTKMAQIRSEMRMLTHGIAVN